jgi:lysozyme
MIDNKKMIVYDEGRKLKVYKCTKGFRTVGIGCNLDANPHLNILHRTLKIGDDITPEECNLLFDYDYSNVINSIKQKIYYFGNLPERYQTVLVNMVYQMGINGLLRFKGMLKAMQIGDDLRVITEMKDSLWYTQTKNRANRLISIIRGVIPKEYL